MTDTVQLLLLCGASILVGGVFIYLLFVRRKPDKHITKQEEQKHQQSQSDQRVVNDVQSFVTSKKQAKSKKRREAQQEFSHSWMVGALKGHTAPVIDLNFSANGKFLASCAEEAAGKSCTARDKKLQQQPPPSPSGSSKSSSSSSSKQEPQRAILSRRQRKNRTRAPRRDHDDRPPPPSRPDPPVKQNKSHRRRTETGQEKTEPPAKPNNTKAMAMSASEGGSWSYHYRPEYGGSNNKQRPKSYHHAPTLAQGSNNRQRPKSHHYALTLTQGSSNNKQRPKPHPRMPSLIQGKVDQQWPKPHPRVPPLTQGSVDQQWPKPHPRVQALTQGRVDKQQLKPHHYVSTFTQCRMDKREAILRPYCLRYIDMYQFGYPVPISQDGRLVAFYNHPHWHQRLCPSGQRRWKCGGSMLNANAYEFVPASSAGSAGSSDEEASSDSENSSLAGLDLPQGAFQQTCMRCKQRYWVRPNGTYVVEDKCRHHWGKLQRKGTWDCCGGRFKTPGCETAPGHVTTGFGPGLNGPFLDFVLTEPARCAPPNGRYGVYSLDCEMCFTTRGLEVGRVTLVDLNGALVYEAMVLPDAPIIDYNSRFSGLVAKHFANAKRLGQVQRELKSFISSETILIGHGMENDLRALRLVHPNVIDTAACFPEFRGYPFRNSLQNLAATRLDIEIHGDSHDSAEDARAALDLVYCKLSEDLVQRASAWQARYGSSFRT